MAIAVMAMALGTVSGGQFNPAVSVALSLSGHDALLIASGVEKYAFLDDRPYLFQPDPHFKHWLPLTNHPYSWIVFRKSAGFRAL